MQNFIISLLFQFIPEAIVLTFLTVIFLRVEMDKKKIFIIGLISGFLTYLYRLLPLTFGFHSLFSLFTLTVLTGLFFKEKFLTSFLAALKSFILLSLIEVVSLNLFLYLANTSAETVLNNPELKTIAVLTQTIILFTIGIIYNKRISKEKSENKEI